MKTEKKNQKTVVYKPKGGAIQLIDKEKTYVAKKTTDKKKSK